MADNIKKCEVISCSRRTDIPAFKMPWILEQIRKGTVEVANPRNCEQVRLISLSREHVRCFAWWSKDYAEWIRAYEDPQTHDLLSQYDAHIFNFTINGDGNGHNPLEPGLRTSLDERLAQVAWLSAHFGPHSIVLRFDPIVHYRVIRDGKYVERDLYGVDGEPVPASSGGYMTNNLCDFAKIISFASLCGVKYVAVAFTILYPRIVARLRQYRTADGSQIELVDIPMSAKRTIIEQMRDFAASISYEGHPAIQIRLCCVAELSDIEDVGMSSCIDGEQINEQLAATGKRCAAPLARKGMRKDSGQREICHCIKSVDIAGYGIDFACPHSCIYCYANPKK